MCVRPIIVTLFAAWFVLCPFPGTPLVAQSENGLYDLISQAQKATVDGDYVGAIEVYEAAAKMAEEQLGPGDANTIVLINNLVVLQRAVGQLDRAEERADRAIELSRAALGDRDIITLLSMNNRAMLYEDRGRIDEARKLYEKTLEGRRETLGPEHPDTLITMNKLAKL
jgi:tetratricopeptide (TPR) repeat protein